MLTIHRYELSPNAITELLVDSEAKTVGYAYQEGRKAVSVFLLLDSEAPSKSPRRFLTASTGQDLTKYAKTAAGLVGSLFSKTVTDAAGFEVFHVFQIL